jgi:membrane associated rhomboid family serine protease
VLPLRDENPARSVPVVTWVIIAACVAVFLFWQPTPWSSTPEDVDFTLRWAAIPCELTTGEPLTVDEVVATFRFGDDSACGFGSPASPPFEPDKDVWLAALVSMFLHGSIAHLAGNMLFLWVFGNNVEDRLGKVGFVLFYLVGGIAATVAHVALDPSSTVPVVGASGAIAAVMGAYMVWYPNAPIRTLVLFITFITVVDVRAKWLLGLWFVFQFFTDPNEGVAWMAHVGGFVFGVAVAWLLRNVRRPPEPLRPPPGHRAGGWYRPPHPPPPPPPPPPGWPGRW